MTFPSPSRKASAARSSSRKGILSASRRPWLRISILSSPKSDKFDGVRSFGEQAKHVACAQFAFFNDFEGKKPPEGCEKGGHDPAKTKTELIEYLKGSFDDPNRILVTLTAKNALDPIVIAPTAAHDAKPAVLLSRTVSTVALWWMWHSMV
jgi:hypothetical protein